MASALFSEDLTCSICLTLFTDPVTLLCGHSFCRACVTGALSTKQQCPLCQTVVSVDGRTVPGSHALRSLVEKAVEAERTRRERGNETADLCPEHEEKLKLFCVTDQQLACIICRDGERHEGHRFKPIKEAAAALRKELEANVDKVCGDILATESLVNKQREEIRLNKERSQQLMTQIHRQFEEMHQFLEKREKEIKSELTIKEEESDKKMNEALKAMETALSESRDLEAKAASVLKIEDPERFLKSWTEDHTTTPAQSFRAAELDIVTCSLSLGPYESHLQFFVWKQMLQVIQPREERLTLNSNNPKLTVSEDGRCLFSTVQKSLNVQTLHHDPSINAILMECAYMQNHQRCISAFSVDEFSSGQHYWEVEVGKRDFWELGLQDNLLRYEGQGYVVCGENEVQLNTTLQKVGIYINCSSHEISFYDADTMTLIHTSVSGFMTAPVLAYFNLRYKNLDYNPVIVCWY